MLAFVPRLEPWGRYQYAGHLRLASTLSWLRVECMQCLKSPLMPEDIANFVVFLAADDSRMCTNQHSIVDAGWV